MTYTEWTTLYGGKKSGVQSADDVTFKRLPFDHCCLSLIHFENPYCDQQGNIFELQMVVDFVEHFKVNPVTGKVSFTYCYIILINAEYINIMMCFFPADGYKIPIETKFF